MASNIEMKERRAAIFDRMKSMVVASEKRGTDFTSAEQKQWVKDNADVESLTRAIHAQEARERATALANAGVPTVSDVVDADIDAFARGDGRRDILVPLPNTERRDLLAGSGTGANVIPVGFVRRLREHLIESSGIRQTNVTVLTTGSGEPLRVPKTTAHPTVSGITAEGGTITESDPTLALVTLDAYKYANLEQLTSEFVQDEAVNIVEYLARANGRALGNASGVHFITGTGTGQPRGVVTAATVGKTFTAGAVAGAIPPGDIIDLFHSVLPEYRRNGYWLMSDAMAAKLRKIRDASGASADTGNLLWQPGLQAGMPDLLLGRPVVIDPNVAAPAANAKSIVFGDFSGYYIRDVGTLRFERSDHFAFNQDLVTFRAVLRTDGDLVDESAVKVGQFAAT